MTYTVICPYCNKQTKLITSLEFYGVNYNTHLYVCEPCDARVGTHKNSLEPLGTMANATLRKARMDTHKIVDRLWQNPFTIHDRSSVYKAIAKLMNMLVKDTHIGMFDYDQCQKVVSLVQTGEVENYLHEQNRIKREKRKERKKQEKERFMKTHPGRLPNGTTDIPIPKGETLYGIFSTVSKRFLFNIQEPSKKKANKKLFEQIGKDAYKHRFEIRKLKHYVVRPKKDESLNRERD